MRKNTFVGGEYYHIYNRGVEKRDIFLNDDDRWRFLTLLVLLQGDTYVPQIGRVVPYVKHLVSDISVNAIERRSIFRDILTNRTVELVGFCLMPNHFHLILHEMNGKGISRFMQRLGDSYTKYFNTKYERSGHLFNGVFQAVHIDNDEYLTYLSAYIHLNPHELTAWRRKEATYPWSSFQDYVGINRWRTFLNASIVLDQFNVREYKQFVVESDIKGEVDHNYLIDALSNT